jgi:CDP-ribitol ribitolphosphotransferase
MQMDYEIVSRNNTDNYKVSVIVPVYNVEDYLNETLTSIEEQTLKGVEIILVDDGSTDNSDKIIMSFLEKNADIVYVKQRNKGPGQARNVGIELARGEFISFLDSDDLLPQNALETMYSTAAKEHADLVIGASLSFNSNRTWYISSHMDNGVYVAGEKTLIRNPELLYSVGPCNKLYKTDMIKGVRFPTNIKVTEDHPFVIEAYLKSRKIVTIDQVIYKYRRRETEENVSLSQKLRVNSLSVLKDIMKSLKASSVLWDQYISNPYAREATKAFYYNRIIRADIWPVLNQALRSKEGSVQKETLEIINDWLQGFTFEFFNKLHPLHQILTYELVLRFAMLMPETHGIYLKTISTCLNLMDPGSEHDLEVTRFRKEVDVVKKAYSKQSVGPLKTYVFKSRVKKVFVKSRSLLKNGSIRRVFYPVFRLLPIKKKIIFASNKMTTLGDSYEYIYQELRLKRPNYIVKGYFKQSRNFKQLFKFYYDIATAKYIVLDDYYRPFYNLSFRKGTEVIQMWHAAGAFKKFGFSAIGSNDSNTEKFEKNAHGFYTKAVVTGEEVVSKYADAFRMPEKNVYPLGLPRTDLFFSEEKLAYIKEQYLGLYPQLKNKKIITYAPTFRGGPKERANFTLRLNMKAMARALGEDYILVLKLHPSVRKKAIIPKEIRHFVLNLSSDEMNNVLAITDILISDYSSLIFEFALLKRPMLFFAYDLDQYINERGFYYDFESFVPGPIIETTEGLIKEIQANEFDLEKIDEFKHKFFTYLDGCSSKRFVETLIEP